MSAVLDMINNAYYMPHINHAIFSYLGKHPNAKMVDDYFKELKDAIDYNVGDCRVCGRYEAEYYEHYDNNEEHLKMCHYCYAETLGTFVYTCNDCSCKTYEYELFNNTEGGLYCNECMEGRNEEGELIWD